MRIGHIANYEPKMSTKRAIHGHLGGIVLYMSKTLGKLPVMPEKPRCFGCFERKIRYMSKALTRLPITAYISSE